MGVIAEPHPPKIASRTHGGAVMYHGASSIALGDMIERSVIRGIIILLRIDEVRCYHAQKINSQTSDSRQGWVIGLADYSKGARQP
jgi:hypothetical protein